jgi:hypothetical protein
MTYDPQTTKWTLADVLASSALPDGFDAYVPLSSLGKNDSRIHFKALAYTFSGVCPPESISMVVKDVAPDTGKTAATSQEATAELPAPQPLSPADGAALDSFPRMTKLSWSSVPGAVSYLVQVQYQDPSSPAGWRPLVFRRVADTTHEFDFVGAQAGRWRVWAIGANGLAGASSSWMNFRHLP